MTTNVTITRNNRGFTLVELSIVLVIIGLIVGGVLTGRDMIRAAEIRSTISQIESYNTSVNVFRDKFASLPGDMTAARATQFGMITRDGTVAEGDGNRLIEACASRQVGMGCETALFWADLSSADLVDERFAAATTTYALPADTVTSILPTANLGQGNFVHVFPNNGRNTFLLSGVTAFIANGGANFSQNLTPQTAFNIDDKLDDGDPTNGSVTAIWDAGIAANAVAIDSINQADDDQFTAGAIAGTGTPTSIYCAANTAAGQPYIYNTSGDGADLPFCQLAMRTSF